MYVLYTLYHFMIRLLKNMKTWILGGAGALLGGAKAPPPPPPLKCTPAFSITQEYTDIGLMTRCMLHVVWGGAYFIYMQVFASQHFTGPRSSSPILFHYWARRDL